MKFKTRFPGMTVVLRPTRKSITDGQVFITSGKRVHFDNKGFLELTDEKDIKSLQSKHFYGKDYFEVKVDSEEILKQVQAAVKTAKADAEAKADETIVEAEVEKEVAVEANLEAPEAKPVLSYKEFQKSFYDTTEGKGVKECATSWQVYKKTYRIK